MPIAVESRDVSFLVVGFNDDFLLNNRTIEDDIPTPVHPAHLRIMNDSCYGFAVTMMSSGSSFYLRPNDDILIPLIAREKGFWIECVYINNNPASQRINVTYFTSREEVYTLGPISARGGRAQYEGLSATAVGAFLPTKDTPGYLGGWLVVQLVGTWVATLLVQECHNNTNFVDIAGTNLSTGVVVTSMTTNGMYKFPIEGTFTRVRVNAYTSGTISGIVCFYSL